MIVAILGDILLGTQLYWVAFVYTNIALGFFLVRVTSSHTHTPADIDIHAQCVSCRLTRRRALWGW